MRGVNGSGEVGFTGEVTVTCPDVQKSTVKIKFLLHYGVPGTRNAGLVLPSGKITIVKNSGTGALAGNAGQVIDVESAITKTPLGGQAILIIMDALQKELPAKNEPGPRWISRRGPGRAPRVTSRSGPS